jgi:hypothetical protein
MSKKHKRSEYQMPQASQGMSHEAEYRIIKFDLLRVVILNAVYLAIILSLYFANQQSHFLDNWFAKILHF